MKKLTVVLLMGVVAAGCGVVKKGGGSGKAVLTLSSRADSLNWDEQGGVHSVEVRAFVLNAPERFMQGSIADLFELKQQRTFWNSFSEDTLAMEKITLDPGQKKVVTITYSKAKAATGQVYLAVIGNFNRPPDGSKERRYVKLGAGGGKAAFYVPKNTIELPPKK
ncbi:MAG: type VI secretion system lipoprotein TssJ [candidate division Zixibacteria bacterium]|nr:type VI secretion system lipoprotein TssJ [candidate division Zixibacteria bacterium]